MIYDGAINKLTSVLTITESDKPDPPINIPSKWNIAPGVHPPQSEEEVKAFVLSHIGDLPILPL